jgi:hypothetical protein
VACNVPLLVLKASFFATVVVVVSVGCSWREIWFCIAVALLAVSSFFPSFLPGKKREALDDGGGFHALH